MSDPLKLHPEDPRLTAWMLGELSTADAAAVASAVAADPALQAAVKELEIVRELLTENLSPGTRTLLPDQRETILQAAREADARIVPLSKATGKRWIMPLAAAAALVLLGVVLTRQKPASTPGPTAEPSPSVIEEQQRTRVKLMPAPGPVDAGKSLASSPKPSNPDLELPSLLPRNYVAAADFPTLDLPVQSGKSSLEWIRNAVLTQHRMPHRDEVRLEEILNSFSLRPAGPTVIGRSPAPNWHPDSRDSGMTSHTATISTEAMACPWKPSATLVLVSIRGNAHSDSEIKALFRANAANVSRYRLLGFCPVLGRENAPLPTTLAARSSNLIALEIEPSTIAGPLGNIDWSVNGENAATVSLNRPGAAEPSDDARFAALVCTYAQWLAGEDAGLIDKDLLAALAREIASESLSGDRVELLHLIDRSLDL